MNCNDFVGTYFVNSRDLGKFFEKMYDLGSINPLILILIYNFVLSGELNHQGYKISVDN